MYAACRDDCRAFEHFGVWPSGAATVTGASEPEQVTTVTVTPSMSYDSAANQLVIPMNADNALAFVPLK